MTAVPIGGSIVVEPGTYPAFTVTKPVRVMGLGGPGSVTIDTRAAPIVIKDLPAVVGDVSLYGLKVGSGAGSFGVQVLRCANVIVLDTLDVAVGLGVPGILVDTSPKVAVQTCALLGDPGLRVIQGSTLYLSAGSVDRLLVENASRVTRAGVTPGSTTIGTGSRVDALTGTMPALAFDQAARSSKVVRMKVSGDASAVYVLFLGFAKGFLDVSPFATIDMVLLVDLGFLLPLQAGVLPPTGAQEIPLPIPVAAGLWGNHVSWQPLTLDAITRKGRLANVRDMVIVP
jgi:hypothetical protein